MVADVLRSDTTARWRARRRVIALCARSSAGSMSLIRRMFTCVAAPKKSSAVRFAQFPRDDIVLATKVYFPRGSGPNDRGVSRMHIREQR